MESRGQLSRGSWWARVTVVALTVVMVVEVLRTLYPLGYALVGDLGFVVTPAVLLLVFLAPALTPLLRRAGGRGAILAAIAGMVVVRLGLQLLAPAPLWAGVLATVVVLVAATCLIAAVLSAGGGAGAVAVGTVAAFGVDASLKAMFAAWDRVWQPTAAALVVTTVVCVAFVGVGRVAVRQGLVVQGDPLHGRARRMFAFAVLLVPSMLLIESVAFVASSGGAGLVAVTLALAVGAALAVVVTVAIASRGVPSWLGWVCAGALAVVVWAMTAFTGGAVVALAIIGQPLVGLVLLAVLDGEPAGERRTGMGRSALGSVAGFVAMFVLTLLYPMHYEMPLPISNTWLPVIAVLLTTVALGARREPTSPAGAGNPVVVWFSGLVPAGVLVGFGALVAVGLAASAAEHEVRPAALPVRVATFNIDQGERGNGALDFEAVADAVDSTDADLVALQEVGRGWPLSGMNDFALWMEHTHGTQQFWAPAADDQFGNLLISRIELAGVERVALPKGDGSMNRSAIVARVDTPDGTVTVIAVHLQHRNSAAGIEARALELQTVLDAWDGAPMTIVLGDFNANNQRPDGGGPKVLVRPDQANTLQPLLDASFTTTQPTEVCTAPTSNDNCSDYVFVTPDLGLVPAVEVLPEQVVSDHHPVVATVVLLMTPMDG